MVFALMQVEARLCMFIPELCFCGLSLYNYKEHFLRIYVLDYLELRFYYYSE